MHTVAMSDHSNDDNMQVYNSYSQYKKYMLYSSFIVNNCSRTTIYCKSQTNDRFTEIAQQLQPRGIPALRS